MRGSLWSRSIVTRFAAAVFVLSGAASAQTPERHSKTIKQCNDELKKNAAALATAGESAADFIHVCWWQTTAGHPTPIRGMKTGSGATDQPSVDRAAAEAAQVAKAKADAEAADAEAEVVRARQEVAAAKAEAARSREAMIIEAAKADAATKAQKAAQARVAAAEAAARADAVVAAKAATEAKDKRQDNARAAAATKSEIKADAAAPAAGKAQQTDASSPPVPSAGAIPMPATAAPARPRVSTVDAVPPAHVAGPRPRRFAREVRSIIVPRHVVRYRAEPLPPTRHRVRAAQVLPVAPAPSDPTGMVAVPVRIPGLGLQRPIAWPVLPAFAPAFREVVNHPIVEGFTATP